MALAREIKVGTEDAAVSAGSAIFDSLTPGILMSDDNADKSTQCVPPLLLSFGL